MGNFNRNSNRSSGGGFSRGFDGNKSFGGKRSGGRDGGRDGGRPTMHRATCSECGDSCEVPFRPTGNKPVFCSNCFGKQDSRGDRDSRDNQGGRSGGFSKERHRDRDKEMYNVVCDKCGKNCQVPFKPTGDKPVFCSDCFGKDKGGSTGGGSNEVMEQIKMLNKKIDRLTEMLIPKTAKKNEEKAYKIEIPKKEVKKTVKTKKGKAPKKEVKKTAKKKK